MSPEQSGGPAELVLMALVSRRYFIDGAVKIDISYPGTIDVDASSRLQHALGLRHALVLDAVEDTAAGLRADLGAAAAELLSEIVTADDVLGLAWARSVSAMSAALTRLAPCTVVQMTGALPGPEVDA